MIAVVRGNHLLLIALLERGSEQVCLLIRSLISKDVSIYTFDFCFSGSNPTFCAATRSGAEPLIRVFSPLNSQTLHTNEQGLWRTTKDKAGEWRGGGVRGGIVMNSILVWCDRGTLERTSAFSLTPLVS